jgi:hypothetical protein
MTNTNDAYARHETMITDDIYLGHGDDTSNTDKTSPGHTNDIKNMDDISLNRVQNTTNVNVSPLEHGVDMRNVE